MIGDGAVEEFRGLIEEFKSRDWNHVRRGSKKAKDLNFMRHDRKDIEEMIDVLSIIREEVEKAARRAGLEHRLPSGYGKGRPTVGCKDLAKAVLVQEYFGCGYRRTAKLLAFFKSDLNIEKSFSYKTIERAYERPRVKKILEKIYEMMAWTLDRT